MSQRTICGLAVLALIATVLPARAQDEPARLTAGAAIGPIAAGNDWSGGGGGVTAAVHFDLRVNRLAGIRIDGGRMRWVSRNDPSGDPRVSAGGVQLSHVGVTALRHYDGSELPWPRGFYFGWGVARYRYAITNGHVGHPVAWGIHGVGGYEHLGEESHWGYYAEGFIQAVGGPGHSQVWATILPMLGVRVGVSRRF